MPLPLPPEKETNLLGQAERCVRCGRCKEVCPSYRATRDERKVARGRLKVLQKLASGELAPSPGVREIIDACLKCHQCAYICPLGIETVRLYREGRSLIRGPGMRSLLTRLIFRVVLPRRRLYNILIRLARWVQKLAQKRGTGLRHIPLMFEGKRNMPQLSKRPALSALPNRSGSGPKAAFFVGCLENYVYPGTASNAVNLLIKAGFEVAVPSGQLCCGLPALYLGDTSTAARLAGKNASTLSGAGVEYVVTACATCATMLKEEYPRLLGQDCFGGAQVMEICEFLAAKGYKPKGGAGAVAYHDPCHLRFAQRIKEQPRQLLSAVAEVREPEESGRCCGGGGTFSIFHYGLSREIGAAKAKMLKETGAGTVATACPGCMAQLCDVLGGEMEVCHVVDFIAKAGLDGNYVEQGDFIAAGADRESS